MQIYIDIYLYNLLLQQLIYIPMNYSIITLYIFGGFFVLHLTNYVKLRLKTDI